MRKTVLIFSILVLVLGCQKVSSGLEKEFMPNARGEVGEIILVMDSTQYEGELGDLIRETFREPMRGLPQDEPMFSLGKSSPKRLNSVLRSAANMIFVMTLDSKTSESNVLRGYFTDESLKTIQRDTTRFMATRTDEFAKGQLVLYLFSSSEELLMKKIRANRGYLQELFESVERQRLQSKLLKSRAKEIEKAIAENHDFTIGVPYGWELGKNTKNFVWYRLLEADKEQNVFVYHEPYRSADIFNDIGRFRDKITETNLRDSEKPGLYITRQQRDDFIGMFSETTSFDGNYAVKTRGLWKISDNSGGGPYISYTIVDEANQRVYYIEGYVYSPGTKKKNYIRGLDTIINSFKINSAG